MTTINSPTYGCNLFTMREIGNILGVPRHVVYKWAVNGMPAMKGVRGNAVVMLAPLVDAMLWVARKFPGRFKVLSRFSAPSPDAVYGFRDSVRDFYRFTDLAGLNRVEAFRFTDIVHVDQAVRKNLELAINTDQIKATPWRGAEWKVSFVS